MFLVCYTINIREDEENERFKNFRSNNIIWNCYLYGIWTKKRIVQSICKDMGNYEATKGEELMDGDKEVWYCCVPNKDKNTKNCLYYGE